LLARDLFLAFGDVPVGLREMPALLIRHRFAFASTRRPASVIRPRAASILREPATMLATAVASLARTSSTMSEIEKPLARSMPSVPAFVTAAVEQFERADAVGACSVTAARNIAAPRPKMFYNCPDRCAEMRAFSGLRWKTHVLDGASEIAKKRKCGLLNQSHTRSISC
jgi:hypothetical protein